MVHFTVTSITLTEQGPIQTNAKLILNIALYDTSTNPFTRVSPDLLGTYHYTVTNTSGNLYIQFGVVITNNNEVVLDTTLETRQSYNEHSLWEEIPGTDYILSIRGILVVEKDNENHAYRTETQDLQPVSKNYNYVTNVHMKNAKYIAEDSTREEEIKEWWDSVQEVTVSPYPLTRRGTSSSFVFTPSLPEGLEYFWDAVEIEDIDIRIGIFDSSSGDRLGKIEGKLVYDNPSEVISPLSLPAYNDK